MRAGVRRDATNAYGEATKVASGCQPAGGGMSSTYILPILITARKFLNYRVRASHCNERHVAQREKKQQNITKTNIVIYYYLINI